MNPKHMAILGAGVIGAGALILMGGSQAQSSPGGVGGPSKKEEATVGPVLTETTETTEPIIPQIIYNITMPAPDFPATPQAPLTVPWWLISPDPAPTSPRLTKKEVTTKLLKEKGIAPPLAPLLNRPGISLLRHLPVLEKRRQALQGGE